MAKFRFEFESDEFQKGECWACPLSYYENTDNPYVCVMPIRFGKGDKLECPLEEVEE